MSTIKNIAAQAREDLQRAFPNESVDILDKEVSMLLSSSLGLSREQLITRSYDEVDSQKVDAFRAFIGRRILHEPIAYILGTQEFYSLEFSVGPEVLIPRRETEMIVDRALELHKKESFSRIIDIGCGSGAIVLSLAFELRKQLSKTDFELLAFEAYDISPEACTRAADNSRSLNLDGTVNIREANLLELVEHTEAGPTLFVSNPPYVPDSEVLDSTVSDYEPRIALRGGEQGLDVIGDLFSQLRRFLQGPSRSLALVEIGIDQWAGVEYLARENALQLFKFHEDLQGIRRVAEVGSVERDSMHNRG